MEEENNTLNIVSLVELMNKKLNHEELKCLETALQSIGKRAKYCTYHYNELVKHTEKKALLIDRLNSPSSDNIAIRTIYEANTVAFMQNLHALIDSLPYILNIIFKEYPNIEDTCIGWNKKFVTKYNSYNFFSELESLYFDETFHKIKGYANRIKHKHLIRISNDGNILVFEDFLYYHDDKSKVVKEQDVISFLTECHNDLIPKTLSLYNTIKKSKEKEISDG